MARCTSLTVHRFAAMLVFLVAVDFRFRPFEGGPSFTVAELGAYAIALLYLGHFSARGISWKEFLGNAYRNNRAVFWYFAWVAVALAAGIARSKNIAPAVKDLVPSLIVYLVVVYSVREEKQFVGVLWAYLAGMGINGVLGAVQAQTNRYYFGAMHDITLLKTDQYGSVVDRLAMGFLQHPNGFAMFIMPAILLAAFLIRFRYFEGASRKVYLSFLLGLLSYNLYRTYSKGAVAWTVLGLVLMVILPRFRERWRYPLCVMTLVLGIASLVSIGIFLFLYHSTSFGTVVGRLVYWGNGVAALFGNAGVMLFGGGSDDIAGMMTDAWGNTMKHAHNGYLNQGLDYGIPAMVFFSAAVLTQMKRGATFGGDRRAPGSRGIHLFRYFFLASSVAYFGEYFFEPAQQGVNLQALTFLLFSLPMAASGIAGPPGGCGRSAGGYPTPLAGDDMECG